MSLLSPWGLWWLLSVPLLVTFYLFRPEPRRRLSTTFFLWRRSAPESQGGVYAKRLRSNPLLWLQILILILLALYLARPATSWSTLVPTSAKVVMVIDRSASMNAGDAFEQALDKAQEAVDGLFGFANFGSQPEVMLLAVDKEPQILVPFTSDAVQLRSALASLKPTEAADRLETLRPFLASLVSDQKATVWLFGDHLPAELEISGLQFTACGTEVPVNAGLVAFSVELTQESGAPKPFVYARVQNFSASAEQRLLRVEKMELDDPDKVESIVVEASLLLPAGGGHTMNESFPAARLSTSEPSLFRARLLPIPGATTASLDGFSNDDTAYTIAPPYGQQRVRVSVTPDLKASFLVRALMATQGVEVLDWERLLPQGGDERPLDLLICAPNSKLPAKPLVRTKFEVSEAAPAENTPVEVLRANPDQPLVKDAGAEWSRLRVQRDTSWPVGAGETTLLSTASGPALTLKGVGEGQPTLCWRFPVSYSSLPLSPALPVLVSRFLDEYSRPASLALVGSFTTNERRSRPAGAIWKGKLELQPALTSALANSGQVDRGDRQLPRLGYAGFYKVRNLDSQSTALLAVNLFSTAEGQLPRTREDRSFSKEETAPGPSAGQQRQYRESTTPLAALALLLLLIEAAVFLRRGRP
jgi:hypothetical protein